MTVDSRRSTADSEPLVAGDAQESKLRSVQMLAESLLARHLPGWQFAFNRQRRTLGLCRYREQRIELSRPHAEAGTMAQARETLLHEIAHALAGPGTGHGPRWRHHMQELGVEPAVTAQPDYRLNDYRWALVRREGNQLHWIAGRYRRPQNCVRLALRGHPDTVGTVFYCAFNDFRAWQAGELPLHALELLQ